MLCTLDDSSLQPCGGLRVAVSRLNGDVGAGRNGIGMLRIGRNDRKGISLYRMSETVRTIALVVSRISIIHTKAFLFTVGFSESVRGP